MLPLDCRRQELIQLCRRSPETVKMAYLRATVFAIGRGITPPTDPPTSETVETILRLEYGSDYNAP
jgi:hypothetical protein